MGETQIPQDIVSMSFEDALKALEDIVKGLESSDIKLDQAIESYSRGAALKQHCENKLREAQAKIEQISLTADGTLDTEPANLE